MLFMVVWYLFLVCNLRETQGVRAYGLEACSQAAPATSVRDGIHVASPDGSDLSLCYHRTKVDRKCSVVVHCKIEIVLQPLYYFAGIRFCYCRVALPPTANISRCSEAIFMVCDA